jgi:hypothetical protein
MPQALQVLTLDGDRIARLHGFVRPVRAVRPACQAMMRGVAYNEELAERVRSSLADRTDVEERKMFGGLSFMVAGQMCCGVLKNDLADPEVLQTWVHRGTDYVAAHSAAAKRRKHG